MILLMSRCTQEVIDNYIRKYFSRFLFIILFAISLKEKTREHFVFHPKFEDIYKPGPQSFYFFEIQASNH